MRPGDTPGRFSWRHRARSFCHAWAGLTHLVASEHNARIHLAASLALLTLACSLGVRGEDWRWLIAAMAAVWAAEAFNTALERVCDLVSPQPHPLVMQAKDLAAAAVLAVCGGALLVGALTLWPYVAARWG